MIFVLGANGQLGLSLQKLGVQPIICDITDPQAIDKEFQSLSPGALIINAAAFTAVDLAEEDASRAFLVNQMGVKNIAKACEDYDLSLIHISTDYVFDGESSTPYTEYDGVNPKSVYGKSKLAGEDILLEEFSNFVIIRTSWVYSEYRSNFLKTMLKLKDRESLSVVYDQVGTPTYAGDLAVAILAATKKFSKIRGETFHYSNEGVCSWYDFAKEIFELSNIEMKINPIESRDYPQKASRPHYSVLNKKKIKESLNIEIPHWKESLKVCLKNLS
ncbi:dTDP-4-dehydrorhamnose reductase [Bacteriovorax sp. Seq25_V]|uniref:dTDP-4-dehydrorhamnose reductase n=1 Tax=Bacteriovorax sp. Seq25_V TaxID=1201288 RepID=UPI00038A1343|nr:dTDP-4-dehydrorhamnose reductase [Bacteriovorax sp. Seq25_V]EQC43378.1 dTDP-4-dehydrorhamnose reductase [Bacteriovorax sp. Seq25_V]